MRKTYMTWAELDKLNIATRRAYAAGKNVGSSMWHCPCCNYDMTISSPEKQTEILNHIQANRCGVLTDSEV